MKNKFWKLLSSATLVTGDLNKNFGVGIQRAQFEFKFYLHLNWNNRKNNGKQMALLENQGASDVEKRWA